MTEVIAVHSRSSIVPQCPGNAILLWDGYSVAQNNFGFTGMPNVVRSGSCLRQFTKLTWFSWLAKQNTNQEKVEYSVEDVSRCSVCEVSGSILTLHSQTTSVPECPETWSNLWAGYSYTDSVCIAVCMLR